MHTHIKMKRDRGSGRDLLTLSLTERKVASISNLAVVQKNSSVKCEYCNYIARVGQP